MQRKSDLAIGETYHIYNRGAHKESIFTQHMDYERFLLLMHISNNTESIHLSRLIAEVEKKELPRASIFLETATDQQLVQILAYCLMPNHFHIVLRQVSEDGITKFMRRVATGYSMYFNTCYEHSGVLFQGRFKNKLIDSDEYFRYIFSYVHTNPVDLLESSWRDGGLANISKAREFMHNYPYASFVDYQNHDRRPEASILTYEDIPDFLRQQNDVEELLDIIWKEQENSKDRPY